MKTLYILHHLWTMTPSQGVKDYTGEIMGFLPVYETREKAEAARGDSDTLITTLQIEEILLHEKAKEGSNA